MKSDASAKKYSALKGVLVGIVLLAVLGAIIAAVVLSSPELFSPSYQNCWLTPINFDENNSAPLNTPLTLHVANKRPVLGTGEIVRITVTDTIRGNTALLDLKNNGHTITDPGAGKEFLLVQVKYENFFSPLRGRSISDPYANMNVRQSDNKTAVKDLNDTISPEFLAVVTIPPNGSVEGHMTFIIDVGDHTPRFSYDPIGLGGQCPTFWFALY